MSLPQVILNIRTFDVVLLVMVSYITFRFKSSSNDVPYFKYVWKRIKRLVVPAYIMLTVFFLLSELSSLLIQHTHAFGLSTIISSFLFLDSGIPYIWIVRIFVVIAFFAPVISSLTENLSLPRNKIRLIGVSVISFIIIMVGGAIYDRFTNEDSLLNIFLRSWILMPIIYVAITQIISILLLFDNKGKVLSVLMFLFFIVIMIIKGDIIAFNPDDFKTPPQLYWVVYGLILSVILFMIIPNKRQGFLEFVSINSLNIYLVHIVVLLFYNKFLGTIELRAIHLHYYLSMWVVRYALVLGLSLLMVYTWPSIKTKILRIKR